MKNVQSITCFILVRFMFTGHQSLFLVFALAQLLFAGHINRSFINSFTSSPSTKPITLVYSVSERKYNQLLLQSLEVKYGNSFASHLI